MKTFILPIALAILFMACVFWGWPTESDVWRKVLALCLAAGLGFQIAKAARTTSRVEVAKAWLDCGAFVLVILSLIYLPQFLGWVLLAAGWVWRFLVRNLWK